MIQQQGFRTDAIGDCNPCHHCGFCKMVQRNDSARVIITGDKIIKKEEEENMIHDTTTYDPRYDSAAARQRYHDRLYNGWKEHKSPIPGEEMPGAHVDTATDGMSESEKARQRYHDRLYGRGN